MILAVSLMLFVTPGFSQVKGAQQITICTMPIGSLLNVLGTGLANLITKHTDLNCKAKPLSGPASWLPMMEKGEVEFGLMNARDAEIAFEGKFVYKDQTGGRGFQFLRVVTVGSTNMGGATVRADSGIRTAADFKGKRVAWDYRAHWINVELFMAHFLNLGVSLEDVKKVMVSTYPDGVNALKEGRVDVCYGMGGSPALQEAQATISGGILVLPVDTSPEGIARLKSYSKSYYGEKAPEDSPGMKKDTPYLTVDLNLLSANNVSDEIVYKVMKAIYENYKELWPVHPKFKEWTHERMVSSETKIPYHGGAIKVFKEKGIWKR
jgi:TRAP transporter TAXI family solute receptor